MIGDIALQRIAQACSPVCSCLQDGKNAKSTKTMLECLILAGCYLVTDNGLRYNYHIQVVSHVFIIELLLCVMDFHV